MQQPFCQWQAHPGKSNVTRPHENVGQLPSTKIIGIIMADAAAFLPMASTSRKVKCDKTT
jgi:hypothetical protein